MEDSYFPGFVREEPAACAGSENNRDRERADYAAQDTEVGEALSCSGARSAEKNNIETVIEFLNMAFNKNDVEGAASMLTERYIQHNPYVGDGKNGFMEWIKEMHDKFPALSYKIKHVFADGDFVIVHSRSEMGAQYAVVDIFRLTDGKIDEHWDVSQEIPSGEGFANKNTMF